MIARGIVLGRQYLQNVKTNAVGLWTKGTRLTIRMKEAVWPQVTPEL
jgi:hypothetical protein